MAWFNKIDANDPTDSPDLNLDTEPTMLEELRAKSWFNWTATALAVLILIVIVLFGVRAIHHHLDKNNGLAPANTQNTPAIPGSNSSKASTKSTTSATNSKTKSSSYKSTSSPSTAASNPTPTQVPNTGPGEVIAIFAGSVFAAASLHFIASLRRQN